MKHDEYIAVTAYAGHRGDERPRVFVLGGVEIAVLETRSMWIEEDLSREQKRFFTVKGSDGFLHIVYYDAGLDAWFHRSMVEDKSDLNRCPKPAALVRRNGLRSVRPVRRMTSQQ